MSKKQYDPDAPFNTRYVTNVKIEKPKEFYGPSISNQAGRYTTRDRMDAMIMAGAQLQQIRQDMYDVVPEDVEDIDLSEIPINPLRAKGIDPVDANAYLQNVANRVITANKRLQKKQLLKKNQDRQKLKDEIRKEILLEQNKQSDKSQIDATGGSE